MTSTNANDSSRTIAGGPVKLATGLGWPGSPLSVDRAAGPSKTQKL